MDSKPIILDGTGPAKALTREAAGLISEIPEKMTAVILVSDGNEATASAMAGICGEIGVTPVIIHVPDVSDAHTVKDTVITALGTKNLIAVIPCMAGYEQADAFHELIPASLDVTGTKNGSPYAQVVAVATLWLLEMNGIVIEDRPCGVFMENEHLASTVAGLMLLHNAATVFVGTKRTDHSLLIHQAMWSEIIIAGLNDPEIMADSCDMGRISGGKVLVDLGPVLRHGQEIVNDIPLCWRDYAAAYSPTDHTGITPLVIAAYQMNMAKAAQHLHNNMRGDRNE